MKYYKIRTPFSDESLELASRPPVVIAAPQEFAQSDAAYTRTHGATAHH